MKKEEFVAIGIEEKLAEKAAEASKKELSGFVPKDRFDEVNESKKQLETSLEDYETQMETLKAATGDSESLKRQISELQEQNKKKDEEHKQQMNDLRMTNAIKLAISESAQDSDLVAGLIDREKLILGDDGKVTGLDEQIKSLKESKSFLFKEPPKEEQEKMKPGIRVGVVRDSQASAKADTSVSMKDAIAARLQSQMGQPKE